MSFAAMEPVTVRAWWDSINMFCSVSISEWYLHFPQAQFCPKYVKIFVTWAWGEILCLLESSAHSCCRAATVLQGGVKLYLTSVLALSRKNPLPEPKKGELLCSSRVRFSSAQSWCPQQILTAVEEWRVSSDQPPFTWCYWSPLTWVCSTSVTC